SPIAHLNAGTAGIDFTGANSLDAGVLQANSTGAVNLVDTRTGNINLQASSGSSFTLNASDAAGGITAVGALNAATTNLTSGTGGINFTGANTMNAGTLTANSTGVVNVIDTNNGNINLGASSGSTFTLNASGAAGGITGTGDLTSATVNLTSGTNGITF